MIVCVFDCVFLVPPKDWLHSLVPPRVYPQHSLEVSRPYNGYNWVLIMNNDANNELIMNNDANNEPVIYQIIAQLEVSIIKYLWFCDDIWPNRFLIYHIIDTYNVCHLCIVDGQTCASRWWQLHTLAEVLYGSSCKCLSHVQLPNMKLTDSLFLIPRIHQF